MKRKLSLLLSTILVASAISIPVTANDDISIVVSGSEIECDQPPVIVDGRTLVPLRAITEAVGGQVDWDSATKTVTITKDDSSFSLEIGKTTVKLDDSKIEADVPAQIINERTMVPLRLIAEAFGFDVDWDSDSKTVTISSNNDINLETTTEEMSEETTNSVDEDTTEASTEFVSEESTETTTQVRVISVEDYDYRNSKVDKSETISENVVVDDVTLFTATATYDTISGNDAYNTFAKEKAQKFIDEAISSLGENARLKYEALASDEKDSYDPVATSAVYTSEITYADNVSVSTIVTEKRYKNTLPYNVENEILLTDPSASKNLTIEDLTDGAITTEKAFDAAIAKFEELFAKDKEYYYLDEVKENGVSQSMLHLYRDNNGNYVFAAYKGVLAGSSKGMVSVLITPSELNKLK